MKKIILIILALLAFGCQKKEVQVFENTKDLYKKIDSLTMARSRIDTVLKIQKVERIKIVEKIKLMRPKEVDSTLFCRYKDSLTDKVKLQIATDLAWADCLNDENKMLSEIIKIEEIKSSIKDTIIAKKDSVISEKNKLLEKSEKKLIQEQSKTKDWFWKGASAVLGILLITK